MGKIRKASEIIDNDFSSKKKINDIDRGRRKLKLCSDAEAEDGAERYVRIFEAPECKQFFLKVMYHLPYDERERICEAAQRSWIKSPKKYFTHSAKESLAKYGY